MKNRRNPMRFKDANCGFYAYCPDGIYAGTFEQVKKVCDDNFIESCAWYNATRAGKSVRQANEETLARCKEYGGVPVLRLLPPSFGKESYTREELEYLANVEGAAFRVWPKTDATPITDWLYGWMIEVLEKSKAPLLVSVWEYTDLSPLAEFKAKHPELVLLLTNTNQFLNRQYVAMVKNLPNVYIETTNVIEYYAFESLAAEIGADKILFGTGMPDKEPYDRIYQMLYCELPQEDIEKIAYKNFERIMERGIRR